MKSKESEGKEPRRRRASTPSGLEDQVIAQAMDLAYKRIADGTASDGLIIQVMKMGHDKYGEKGQLEREYLSKQIELASAKTEALDSAKKQEELYAQAMKVFSTYTGNRTDEED